MAMLPSISSLLQMAGSNNNNNNNGIGHIAIPLDIGAAKSAHEIQSLLAANELPKPLTNDVLQQALSELPTGTAQALQSCLSAFQIRRLSPQELLAFVRSVVPQSRALQSVFPEAQVSMGDKLAMPLGPLVLAAPSSLPGLEAGAGAGGSPRLFGLAMNFPAHGSPPLAGAKRSMEREQCASPKFCKTGVKDEPGRTQTAGEGAEAGGGERQACAVQALMDLMGHAPTAAPVTLPPPLALSPHTGADASRLLPAPPSLPLPAMPSPASLGSAASAAASPHVTVGRDCPPEAPAASPPQPSQAAAEGGEGAGSPSGLSSMLDRAKLAGGSGSAPGSPSVGAADAVGEGGAGENGTAHNKYCHFCQHIKVKRASSMLACENRGCNRRFCEHCLTTHLADPRSTHDWRRKGVPWHCPICTKSCCCTMRECTQAHRHCKAYRYRRKRAQQAELDKTTPDTPPHLAFFRPPPFAHPHMPPPHMQYMPYPAFACPPPHPAMHPHAFNLGRR